MGKNEAGKSALLRALHKLNPTTGEDYDIASEWPRATRQAANPEQAVCTAVFALDDAEIAGLKRISSASQVTEVEVSRRYDGNIAFHLPLNQFPATPSQAAIDEVWETWPSSLRGSAEELEPEITRLLAALRAAPAEEWSAGFKATLAQEGPSLRKGASADPPILAQLTAQAAKTGKALRGLDTVRDEAHAFVGEHLPGFIYMDDYRAFTGTAMLDEIKQHVDNKRPTEQDRTLLIMMQLAGLSLDDQVQKATATTKLSRMLDLSDAGIRLTKLVEGRWSQAKYLIQFQADGLEFFTFVQVPEREGDTLIKLEERSRGFQWFFSFDLLFSHQTQADFKDCVLLLDEPGLHLHPDGQGDLVKRLEAYSAENTVVYTTHLPFMLNLREPQRIRVVSESDRGTVVREELTESQPEAKLLLQSALGMGLSQSYLVAPRNLVVEGVHDYWLLTDLSNLFVRSGKKGVNEEVLISPAGGATEAAYLATFMIGQDLEVVALFDSDKEGEEAGRKLVEKWLARYKSATIRVLSLGAVAGVLDRPYSIEDLFPEAYYIERVRAVYKRELESVGKEIPALAAAATATLDVRVRDALGQLGIKFNKGSVAKRIRSDLIAMKDVSELPAETKTAARKVINAINRGFSKAAPDVAGPDEEGDD